MKNFKLLLICLAVLCAGSQVLYAQSKKEKAEKKAGAVKELINSRHYTVDVLRAYPMGGESVNLTSPYSLEIRGDSLISYLPYFGRAYSIPYGGGKALNFDAPISDYSLVYPKKRKAIIKFTTMTNEDIYSYTINIYMNGNTDIIVNSQNRQSINFQGDAVVDLQKPSVNKQ